MYRLSALAYGVFAYLAFLATILYAIGFVGNLFVPRSIDSVPTRPLVEALAIDLALLALFALQHSGMARPAFKRWLTRLVPAALERSTYVLAASLTLMLLFYAWQPLGGVIWHASQPWLRGVLTGGYFLGWIVVFATTFLIDHFELFGLRQAWSAFTQQPLHAPAFVMPRPYRHVRHPLYVGFLIAFWCAPTMTWTHLLFALATTAYIVIAIQLEERDLMAAHPEYADYRRKVPMLLPRLRAADDDRSVIESGAPRRTLGRIGPP